MSKDCCDDDKKTSKKGIDAFLLGIIIFTLLLLGGAVYLGSKMGATAQVESSSEVDLATDGFSHDWGEIDINGGIVSKTFAIENKGDTPLQLYEVTTSCMCTTAQLKTANQTSKRFGMHEKSSSVFEVQPGETADLIVEFDPAFHGPSGVGPINRIITVRTNDATNSTLSFELTGNVIRK